MDNKHEDSSVQIAPPNCLAVLSWNVLFMSMRYVDMSEHIPPPSPYSELTAELPLKVQSVMIAEQ